MSYCLEGIDVAVLAGGLGTRIRGVLQASPLGQIYGFVSPQSAFIDIGTPESLAAAGRVLNWDA